MTTTSPLAMAGGERGSFPSSQAGPEWRLRGQGRAAGLLAGTLRGGCVSKTGRG